MNRRRGLVVGAAAVAAAAGFAAAWQLRSSDRPAGAAFWSRRFPRVDGTMLAPADGRGAPLLLNFWATWCAPCVTEMPLLDAWWRDRASHGWQVLALALDSAESVRGFVDRQRLTLPIALAGEGGVELVRALGNPAGVLPFTVCFGRDGDIARRKIGAVDAELLARWRAELR